MLSRIFRETENAAVNRKRQIDTLKIFNDKYVSYHVVFIFLLLPDEVVERIKQIWRCGECFLVGNHLHDCVASFAAQFHCLVNFVSENSDFKFNS